MELKNPNNSIRLQIQEKLERNIILMSSLLTLVIVIMSQVNQRRVILSREQDATAIAISGVYSVIDQLEEKIGIAVAFGREDEDHREHALDAIMETQEELLAIGWYSENGDVIAAPDNHAGLLDNTDADLQAHGYQSARPGEFNLGSANLENEDTTYVDMSFPVGEGEHVVIRLDLQFLRPIVDGLSFGRTGEIFIMNTSGEVLSYPDMDPGESHPLMEDARIFKVLSGEDQPGKEYVYRNPWGDFAIGYLQPVAGTDWFVMTDMSPIEGLTPAFIAFIFGSIFAIIAAFRAKYVTTFFMDKLIFEPLAVVRLGAEQLGTENLDFRLAPMPDDELGVLARTFNKMADRLQARNRVLATQAESLRQEISERKRFEDQLRFDALHDALTSLPNRTLLQDRLEHSIARVQRNRNTGYAVIFMDLDRFKNVNDSMGHNAGDQLLIEMSRRLAEAVRSVDTVARLGGDEFVILIEEPESPKEVEVIAKRILSVISETVQIQDKDLVITPSLGIVLSHPSYATPDEILRDADIAMYHAKALGKSRYALFSKKMRKEAIFRVNMETDLRLALERDELFLHYQPISSLESDQIAGFEALVRWEHPEQGTIPPANFIPLAEETGLIIPLGMWVLETACRQMVEWNERFKYDPPLHISVNLSGSQLMQTNLVDEVARILEQTGLPGNLLSLEITEGAIIGDTLLATRVLSELKSLDLSIHMDDFGTGYSSLSYLRNFPMDVIKIDRFFVDKMDMESNNSGLVRSIIDMAHELGMDVIAEGIETDSQRAMLNSLGCNLGQGFLFAKPQSAEDVELLLGQPQVA